jgi:hypothetical protein
MPILSGEFKFPTCEMQVIRPENAYFGRDKIKYQQDSPVRTPVNIGGRLLRGCPPEACSIHIRIPAASDLFPWNNPPGRRCRLPWDLFAGGITDFSIRER